MRQFLSLMEDILLEGDDKPNRTGIDTRALFGSMMKFNLMDGFPAMTTKKLAWKAVVSELLWFLEGSSDERRLSELLHGSRDESYKTIWTENAQASYWKPKAKFNGDLGRVYGVQWRSWKSVKVVDSNHLTTEADGEITHYNSIVKEKNIDQIAQIIDMIKNDPSSRRIILSAWNVSDLDEMALPPCHLLTHFNVTSDGFLDAILYQRSCDFFLGVPFNIASYALLIHMIAHVTGLFPGTFTWMGGDVHIYHNHFDAVHEQLKREPYQLPRLWLNPTITDINKFTMEDIKLINYISHPQIKAEMAV